MTSMRDKSGTTSEIYATRITHQDQSMTTIGAIGLPAPRRIPAMQ